MLKRPNSGVEAKEIDFSMKAWDKFMRKGNEGLDADEVKALTVGTAATAGNLAPEGICCGDH